MDFVPSFPCQRSRQESRSFLNVRKVALAFGAQATYRSLQRHFTNSEKIKPQKKEVRIISGWGPIFVSEGLEGIEAIRGRELNSDRSFL